jgi:glycosyltransferase involved in cell wall biosynthesis
MKKAVITVTNDLATDQRVQRSIALLREEGYSVTFVGRRLPGSMPFTPAYETVRFRLPFHRGWLFYASYQLRLLGFLLSRRFDLYWSNDLDTLLPNFLVARLTGRPLLYDSHEYFTGAPELQHRPLVRGIWEALEKAILPRLHHIITVNESIARLYRNAYGVNPTVVRNLGDAYRPPAASRSELGLPEAAFLLINQGSGINVHRGMEEALEALSLLPAEVHLLLVGRGDVLPQLRKQAVQLELTARVHFVPPQPYQELLRYTQAADAGLSLDKANNLNYRYSLPNKVFDYIKCGVPVVASPVVEVRRLVAHYGLGELTEVRPEAIAAAVKRLRRAGKAAYQAGLAQAARENNWAQERQRLREVLRAATSR